MSYAPSPAESADASWQGAALYTPLTAEAADSSWWAASPGGGGATPYTPLPALYADASWQGAAPYTPQAAAAAGASWWMAPAAGELVTKARGFSVSHFGTASRAGPALPQTGVASGEASTLFGLATTTHAARGFTSTTLGAVRSQIVFQATAGPIASPAVGVALGDESVRFGTPSVVGALTAPAAGQAFTRFGAVTSARRFGAVGAAPLALLGTPALRLTAHAHGFLVVRMGAARARRTLPAQGLAPVRWGLPRASARAVGLAQGMCSTQLGEPTHSAARRALHIPPGTRFGRPLLQRNTPC